MCIPHSINCTPRDSALYSKATKRTISVESLRGDWILDISNRISIDRFFKYRMVDGDYLFLLFLSSVCEYGNEGFFRFGIVVERPEIFFLSRIFCEKFTVNLFCSFVCVGNEFFSFFLFMQSVKRVASRFMEFFFLVFE